MGDEFKIDQFGIKSILNQIFISQPQFPITDKQALIRALGGETSLLKINTQEEMASAVILAETAFAYSQVFQDSNDIIDGILGGSFINALTKSKIYQELQELTFPVKHFRDLERLGSTLQLFGFQWSSVQEKLDLPINSSAEIILAISAVDPAVVSTDVSLISGLALPDLTTMVAPPPTPQAPVQPAPDVVPQTPPAPSPPVQPEAPAPPSPSIPEQPAVETQPEGPAENEVELKFGFSYLILEDKPTNCFKVFSKGMKTGYSGLCITRTNPRQIKEKFDLKDMEIHWLTDRKSSGETTLSPALENIIYLIEGFIKKNENSLVLFDGLEYLISVNKFNPVLQFVRRLVDFVSERNTAFLAPISPLTIGEQELKTLEREMEPVNQDEILNLPLNENSGAASTEAEAPQVQDSPAADAPQESPPAPGAPVAEGDGKGCTPCEGTGTCFWCSGTGQCESCKGTGTNDLGKSCDNCKGTGTCDSCKGKKVCVWCKGTGQMVEN